MVATTFKKILFIIVLSLITIIVATPLCFCIFSSTSKKTTEIASLLAEDPQISKKEVLKMVAYSYANKLEKINEEAITIEDIIELFNKDNKKIIWPTRIEEVKFSEEYPPAQIVFGATLLGWKIYDINLIKPL